MGLLVSRTGRNTWKGATPPPFTAEVPVIWIFPEAANTNSTSCLDLGHEGDIVHVCLAHDYATAQRGTAATPCRSGYSDMSSLRHFRARTGPASGHLAWPQPPKHPFSFPFLLQHGCHHRTTDRFVGGPFLCWTHCHT